MADEKIVDILDGADLGDVTFTAVTADPAIRRPNYRTVRVYRGSHEDVASIHIPMMGPHSKDWYTIGIDVIPAEGSQPEHISGSSINRLTGDVLYAEVCVEDYPGVGYGYSLNPEDNKRAARDEAIGTLFAFLRDHFDKPDSYVKEERTNG